jgi:hypothetical protein
MKYLFYLFISFSYLYSSESIAIFGNDYKPPKIWTKEGVTKGILVEVVREVEKELDVKFDIQTHPWARAYKLALNEQGGIVGISSTQERKEIFDLAHKYKLLDEV